MHDKAPDSQTSLTPRVSSFFIENLLGSSKNEEPQRSPAKDKARADVRRESALHGRETQHRFSEVCGQAASTVSTVDRGPLAPTQPPLEWYRRSPLNFDTPDRSGSKYSCNFVPVHCFVVITKAHVKLWLACVVKT